VDLFTRDDRGRLVVTLHVLDAQALVAVAADVRELLQAPPDGNPVAARLFPRAYTDPTEEDAEREWQELVHADLALGKLAALDELRSRFERARPAGELVHVAFEADQEERLLLALNDMRLALGAALGVTADTDLEHVAPSDPHYLFVWLGAFEQELVEFLLEGMPG